MTDRDPLRELGSLLFEPLRKPLVIVVDYLSRKLNELPAPIKRLIDKISERWLNASLIVIVGASVALYLAVLAAKIAGWI